MFYKTPRLLQPSGGGIKHAARRGLCTHGPWETRSGGEERNKFQEEQLAITGKRRRANYLLGVFLQDERWAISCLWKILSKPFCAAVSLQKGSPSTPGHPGRRQGNAPRPGLERFELELVYLALTFLLLESLDLTQTSKVRYSQIFLRLVMRYQNLT